MNRRGRPVKLVVVSNRVARGKPNEPMTGGLAAALLPVVEHSGAIWVGSSGRVRDGQQKEPFAEIEALGSGAIATLDLPAAHYGGYYEGFANSAPWPVAAVMQGVPNHRELITAMLAYDLLGFQTNDDCQNFLGYVAGELGLAVEDGVVISQHGRTR